MSVSHNFINIDISSNWHYNIYRGKKMNFNKTSESEEQQMLMEWAEIMQRRIPELRLLFHIPNGGARSKATAGKLKAEGVKTGVPDLFLPVARGGFYGLFIEMKIKPNKTTENQDKWIAALKEQGYAVEVCYGWRAASQVLEAYLKNNKD